MASAIDAAIDDPSFGLQQLRAVQVSINGSVVVRRYYNSDAAEYSDLQSITKSIVSTLVGIAISESRISGLDANLGNLLPKYRQEMHPQAAQITLKQLLTMTAGWTTQGVSFDGNLVHEWLRQGPQLKPGTQFRYGYVGPHLLAMVLVQATGMSVLDYARDRLLDPLGIATRPAYEGQVPHDFEYWTESGFRTPGFAWMTAPDGTHTGASGMKLRADDLVKLGELYLNEGRWQGRQIVPEEWVHQATAPDSPNQYGYLWWIRQVGGHHGYAAVGSGGQVILVVPDHKMIVVTSTRMTEGDPIFRLIDEAIEPYLY